MPLPAFQPPDAAPLDFSNLPGSDLSDLLSDLATPAANTKKLTPIATIGCGPIPRLERQTARRYTYDLSGVRAAELTIGRLPAPEETFHCIMGGDFAGFDLIVAIQRLASAPITSLTITTLGFNRHNISHLCSMIDAGLASDVVLLASEYFSDSDRSTFAYASAELARRGANLRATRNHSKIVVIRFPDGSAYTIESSANLRSCNNLEQFSLTHSAPLADFHSAWIRRVLSAVAQQPPSP